MGKILHRSAQNVNFSASNSLDLDEVKSMPGKPKFVPEQVNDTESFLQFVS